MATNDKLSDMKQQMWKNGSCLVKFLTKEPERLMRHGILSIVDGGDGEYTAIFGDLAVVVSTEGVVSLLRLAGSQPGFTQDLDASCKVRLD